MSTLLMLILAAAALNLVLFYTGVDATLHHHSHHKAHNLTFYLHEAILTGHDATAILVAGAGGEITKLKQGSVLVVDNNITKTADPKSAGIGKFQGLYVLDGKTKYRADVTVIINQPGDLIETTYEILGHRDDFNAINDRQLAVVAGTGNFLGQRGYAIVHTVHQKLVGANGGRRTIQKWTLVVGKY